MLTFIVPLIVTIFFGIMAAIFSIIAFVARDKNRKNKTTEITAIFSALAGVASFALINLPSPVIYPLDNETKEYNKEEEIIIESYELFETYYSTNGKDPKEGNKYESPFVITDSTTITARNKFLCWWSDISKSAYIFKNDNENIKQEIQDDDENYSMQEEISTESEYHSTESEIPEESSTDLVQEDENPSPSEISTEQNSTSEATTTPSTNGTSYSEGLNIAEATALLGYVNQYRTEAGVNELTWDADLEQKAQSLATARAKNEYVTLEGYFYSIGRQCNGAKNAQKAVADWITGNDYIPSEANYILSSDYTQMGGALYYLPDGNEFGYHYIWYICLR